MELVNNDGHKLFEKTSPRIAISQFVDKTSQNPLYSSSDNGYFPVGRAKKFKLVDTAGFIDGIHPDINTEELYLKPLLSSVV